MTKRPSPAPFSGDDKEDCGTRLVDRSEMKVVIGKTLLVGFVAIAFKLGRCLCLEKEQMEAMRLVLCVIDAD
jgi:hypothetical protein